MSNIQLLHSYAIGMTLVAAVFLILIAFTLEAYLQLRRKTCKSVDAFKSIEGRCRSIVNLVCREWTDLEPMRGEDFIKALEVRLVAANLLNSHVQGILDIRPRNGGVFDSIEAVRAAGAKLQELERARHTLDEYKIGTPGMGIPSKAGVPERVSLLCAMVKRLQHAIPVPDGMMVAPAFTWIPVGLQKEAGDMICAFSTALAHKMHASQLKLRGNGWSGMEWSHRTSEWPIPHAQHELIDHAGKGDPLDVALFAAFLWHHKESTSLAGYMAVTPALESAIRMVLDKVNPEAINQLAESKLKPSFSVRQTEEPIPPAEPNQLIMISHAETCRDCGYQFNALFDEKVCPICESF